MNRKTAYLLSAILLLCGLAYGVRSMRDGLELRGCDFALRMNEVQCSHTGVNPFDVWERTVTTDGFCGLERPDMADAPQDRVGKREVHAYPPWHTTYCWFYGWLPRPINTALLGVAYGITLVFLIGAIRRRMSSLETHKKVFVWSWLFALLFGKLVCCFGYLQYGIVLAALALLMYDSLDRGRDGLAAVCWAVIMVKPQVGVLFFFPLLFGKKYKVIFLTGAICFVATLWPAWIYHTSPFELIMQIPKIGAPYNHEPIVSKILAPLIGKSAIFIWAGVCAAICAVGSWLFRKSGSWMVRMLPVMWIFPLWTYSMVHDHLVAWGLVFVWGMLIVGAECENISPSKGKLLYVCSGIEVAWLVFASVWHLGVTTQLFNPSGIGWIYLSTQALLAWTVVPAVLFVVLKSQGVFQYKFVMLGNCEK